jgi:catecholate siderophore receptor
LSHLNIGRRNIAHRKTGGLLLLALLLLATVTPAARADNAVTPTEATAADDGTPIIHDEIFVEESTPEIPGSSTIAAKLPLALSETPMAIEEVNRDTLELRNSDVLGDALRYTAGVNVQSGNGIFDVFMLRGLDSADGVVMIDGAPEPQTAFFQLYNVERVEVVKGPSSFVYGALAMSGAMNLVRKQPTSGNFGRFGLEGGSDGFLQGTVDANHDGGTWGFRLNGQWLEQDGHRDHPSELSAVNPVFVVRPIERTAVHVSVEAIDFEAMPDSGLPVTFDVFTLASWDGLPPLIVAPVDREQSYDAPFSFVDQQTLRFQVDVESRVSENLVVRNKTYYRGLDWDSSSTILNGFNPLTGGVSRSQILFNDEQTFVGNQLEAVWRKGVHNLLFGVEVARNTDEFRFDLGYLPDIDLYDPVEFADGTFVIPGFGFGTDAEATVVAPYVVDQMRISDKVQITLGLRSDSIDFEDKLTGIKRSDSEVSPVAGIVFSPRESFSIYANAGKAFAPPSTFVVGEAREPEESEQFELGVRGRGERFGYSLAAYRLDRENVAIPDTTGVTRQNGAQRMEGLELELFAEFRDGLTATFNVTYTEAELTEFTEQIYLFNFETGDFMPITVDRSGNAAPWVPENMASLWLSQTLDSGWTVALGGRYVDEQFIAVDNAFAVGEALMADAVIAYRPSLGRAPWGFQVFFNDPATAEIYTRVFSSSSVLPAAGFTASAGFRYEF